MGKSAVVFIAVVVFCLTAQVFAQRGECPLASSITQCSPKCVSDNDCSLGSRCCSNFCNTKSCTINKSSNSQGYKGSSSSATGTYCAGVKCNSYEKCEMDRSSKKMKCVRS